MAIRTSSASVPSPSKFDRPRWVGHSPLLGDAYSLARTAHGTDRRPTDRRYFLDHVVEVAWMLDQAGFDEVLVAVGLLHDSVERGSLGLAELRDRMGAGVSSLVLILSEDPGIASFDRRKAGLRRQVESAGGPAVTVYAADKLSDIRGLRRGIEASGDGIEGRMGTAVAGMAAHYRESVGMIEAVEPDSVFLPMLHLELERLDERVADGIRAAKRDP